MANNVCPDCGKALDEVCYNGITVKKCNCGYQLNTATGEVQRLNPDEPNCVVLCSNCGGKNRIYYGYGDGDSFLCAFCGTYSRFPERPDPSLRSVVNCPHCSGKNRVPANKGKIKVTCSHCSGQFIYNSGTWPTAAQRSAQPKTQPQPKAAPKAKPKAEAPKSAPKKEGFFARMRASAEDRGARGAGAAPGSRPVVIAKKLEALHRTCPHCGCAITKYTTIGQPYPFQFVCWDCKRHFGDLSHMTDEELDLIEREEADCRRVEQLPNLQQIKEACHTAILDKDVVCLTIDQGSVKIVSIKRELDQRIIAHYDPISTYAGNMHLVKLCMEYCRHKSPYFTYSWMNNGFCREKS